MTPADRPVDFTQASAARAQKLLNQKAAARRAYEGGGMTNKEIAKAVGCCDRTLKRWIAEGQWRKG